MKDTIKWLSILVILTIMAFTPVWAQSSNMNWFQFNQDEDAFISVWVDPTFTDGGEQYGIDFIKDFDWFRLKLGMSHYAQLTPNYTDFVMGTGTSFHLFRTDKITYHVGGRLGLIARSGNKTPHPLMGFESGMVVNITDKLRVGAGIWYDKRADLDFYDSPKDGLWNGKLEVIFKLN
tara:strand:+ start:197300 stop:197830 length:531 start_codon:yes stop_codon:yes gene_type:complete